VISFCLLKEKKKFKYNAYINKQIYSGIYYLLSHRDFLTFPHFQFVCFIFFSPHAHASIKSLEILLNEIKSKAEADKTSQNP
jgi:hypothetical protein